MKRKRPAPLIRESVRNLLSYCCGELRRRSEERATGAAGYKQSEENRGEEILRSMSAGYSPGPL